MVSHLRSHTLLFHLVILMVLGNCQTHNSFLQSNLLSDFHFSVSLHEAYKKECLENIQNPEKKPILASMIIDLENMIIDPKTLTQEKNVTKLSFLPPADSNFFYLQKESFTFYIFRFLTDCLGLWH